MMDAGGVKPFSNLDGHQFMNLTTYRKSGLAVVTTVWFAQEGDQLFVWTGADSGKVKRIRNNGNVEVGPSTANGRPLGATATATARLMSADEKAPAIQALQKKYGMQFRFFSWMGRARGGQSVCLEITLPDDTRS